MPFEIMANATFLAHGLFVLVAVPSTYFAFTGLYRTRSQLATLHYLSIAIMALGQLRYGQCPLVVLEEAFRNKAGIEMWYSGGYVDYMTLQLTGIALPAGAVMSVTISLVVFSLIGLVRHHWPAENRPLTA
jgi:hypothetical protein